jgi:hypothetical protein
LLFVLISLFKNSYFEKEVSSDVVIAIITILFLWNSTAKKSRYYTSFFVEAIPIIWLLILLVFYNN